MRPSRYSLSKLNLVFRIPILIPPPLYSPVCMYHARWYVLCVSCTYVLSEFGICYCVRAVEQQWMAGTFDCLYSAPDAPWLSHQGAVQSTAYIRSIVNYQHMG